MSYLEIKGVGRQGPTLGLFLLEVALVRNASRANGMRGMAQRISTTLQQQQTALLGLISYVTASCPAWPIQPCFFSRWTGRAARTAKSRAGPAEAALSAA